MTNSHEKSVDHSNDLSRVRIEALNHAEKFKLADRGIGAYGATPCSHEPSMYAACDMVIMRTIMGEDLRTSLTNDQRREWITQINAFARADGTYQRYRDHSYEHANGMVIGALGVLGGQQKYPVQLYRSFDTVEKVGPWLEKVNWREQWSGSHLFWGGMHCYSMSRECTDKWRRTVLNWLDAELDPETGWWRRGVSPSKNIPALQPLGGAAHIWPIYQHNHRRFPLPEQVIDSILTLQKPDGSWLEYGSYMDMDALYGLNYMNALEPDYRHNDIRCTAHRHGQNLIKQWPKFLANVPDIHLLLGGVGAFGLLNQLLPDLYHDTMSWSDIFSDTRLYRTAEVEATEIH